MTEGENGAGDPSEELEYAVGEVPMAILELAESCRTFVLAALKIELDYEPETLPILDEYLRLARGGVGDRPEAEPLVARAAAAYFGEIVRRRTDAFWLHRKDTADEWQLAGRRVFVVMSPLGMVLEALHRGDDHGGPSAELVLYGDDRALAEARLAAMPPVSEEEYYLLSTRLEVVETILETLREQMKQEGRDALIFEDTDYADE
jgi:hypothetical protein